MVETQDRDLLFGGPPLDRSPCHQTVYDCRMDDPTTCSHRPIDLDDGCPQCLSLDAAYERIMSQSYTKGYCLQTLLPETVCIIDGAKDIYPAVEIVWHHKRMVPPTKIKHSCRNNKCISLDHMTNRTNKGDKQAAYYSAIEERNAQLWEEVQAAKEYIDELEKKLKAAEELIRVFFKS